MPFPASVRDQIFDHKPGAVTYYLDQEVRFDTKACYLRRPSNDVVQKMARLASLTADASAPTELSSEQKAELSQHPQVIWLPKKQSSHHPDPCGGILTHQSRQRDAPL